jgi:hypothetical protein
MLAVAALPGKPVICTDNYMKMGGGVKCQWSACRQMPANAGKNGILPEGILIILGL